MSESNEKDSGLGPGDRSAGEEEASLGKATAKGSPPQGASPFTRPAPGTLISFVALILGGTSLWLAMQTFYVAQRPYIGIIEHNYQLLGAPPVGMTWTFVLSNVGNRPAWVTVDEHRTTVVRDGNEMDLPLLGTPGGGMYLMPGQKAPLSGQFMDANDSVKALEVLTGVVQLRSTVRLSYSAKAPFGGRRHFYYRAVSQFRHYTVPPAFFMAEGDGN